MLLLSAIICVLGASMGQILFKASAMSLNASNTFLAVKPLLLLAAAFSLYFIASMGWVLVLKKAPLGQIYPLMALSFIVVPMASYFVFQEQFTSQYVVGVFAIVVGIMLCLKA